MQNDFAGPLKRGHLAIIHIQAEKHALPDAAVNASAQALNELDLLHEKLQHLKFPEQAQRIENTARKFAEVTGSGYNPEAIAAARALPTSENRAGVGSRPIGPRGPAPA